MARSASPAWSVGWLSRGGLRLGANLRTGSGASMEPSLMATAPDLSRKPQHVKPQRQQRKLTEHQGKQNYEGRRCHDQAPRHVVISRQGSRKSVPHCGRIEISRDCCKKPTGAGSPESTGLILKDEDRGCTDYDSNLGNAGLRRA